MPLVMSVILKCVTSAPSAALRLMTRPAGGLRVLDGRAPVTDGVSATGVTVIVAVAVRAAEARVDVAHRGLHVEAESSPD